MKYMLILISAVSVLFTAGCSPKQIEADVKTMVVGPEFSASKGLYVPDDTRRSIGLKIVEVDEQQIAATVVFSLCVFSREGESVRASGRLPLAHTKMLHPGDSLRVRTKAETEVIAKIVQISFASGIAELVAEIPMSESLSIGTFLKATLSETLAESSTSVPRSALIQGAEGYFVYAASGENFVRTPVTVGAFSKDRAIIKEGLYSGDRVVAEAAMTLWLTELAAIKGGHSCCAVSPEQKGKP